MSEFPGRRVTAIDAELRALREVTWGASSELAEVRRRQAELVDMEAALLVAIDLRRRRIDDLLDQRLRAVVGGGSQASAAAPVRSDAGLPPAAGRGGSPVGASGPFPATG
jgi:hypothetical protein